MATTFEKIRVVGLHCHIGSTIREPEKFKSVFFPYTSVVLNSFDLAPCVITLNFRQSTRVLVDLFNKLRSRFPDLYVLNLGGGLSIPYKSQVPLNFVKILIKL